MSKTLIVPIFVSHMGCPHTCVFCNQRKIAGSFREPTAKSIIETVNSYRKTFRDVQNAYIELAFYGGSFTGIRDDLQEELLSSAAKLKNENLINGIRLSTRPDYINQQIVDRLFQYGVTTVELGVQSMDENVLLASQRGHSILQVEEAVGFLKNSGIQVGIQLMPGLPEDSIEKVLMTTRKVIDLNPNFVRIYPTLVIKETELAHRFLEGAFKPWTLEKAIDTVATMAIFFAKSGIPIIRMGLQAAENLVFGKDLLAGPYHPAFGELVKSRIFRKQIEYLLNEKNLLKNDDTLPLFCNTKDISQIKGQKQANIRYFQEKYDLELKIISKENIDIGSIAFMENNILKIFFRRDFLDKYRNTIW